MTLGIFTNNNPTSGVNNYLAVIQWGDGSVSNASSANGGIVPNGQGGFNIIGSHYYDNETTGTGKTGLPFSIQVQDMNAADTAYGSSLLNLGSYHGPVDSPPQMTSGGPNGAIISEGTETLLQGIDLAHLSTNLIGYNGLYVPAVSGTITSLSYSYDFEVLSGPSSSAEVGVGLLIKQGRAYYVVSGYQGVGQNGWNTLTSLPLTAMSFKLVGGTGPATPNFSAIGSQAGAPIEFGFFTANSSNGTLKTLTWEIALSR